ncbi:MAG: hypothetical protein KGS61_13925 [Verrucomicrobia bacterium]|nr:hypothetical protein [Verrucomicrobiota bacterium]
MSISLMYRRNPALGVIRPPKANTPSKARCGWACLLLASGVVVGARAADADLPLARMPQREFQSRTPWSDPNFFPIAVWLQSPGNAARYRAAGFNSYVGLWRGPTEEQLTTLKQAGMRLICGQNEVALRHRDDPTIIGWMHGDEPDNAQSRRGGGYGPPIPPEQILAEYEQMQRADSTRPVMLNLGQGVAWDNWHGRGVRSRHPEDYPRYVQGCDIASFDIYPVNGESPEVANKLWLVADGVTRLVGWCGSSRLVWNCIECGRIGEVDRQPTPQQVRCEVWMSLIHGSRGLIYFVHQFKPQFREAALLDHPEMLAEVTELNRQITELAPVLNSPSLPAAAEVASANPEVPIDFTMKRRNGVSYLFAVAMRDGSTTGTFVIREGPRSGSVRVLGENRGLPLRDGRFSDHFAAWDVHLYRIEAGGQ